MTLKKLSLFLSILLIRNILCGQFSDDFSDGDFTNYPAWDGNIADFIVNTNHELQLQATAAGSSLLFLPTHCDSKELEWRFYIKLTFSPSANNYARIYLCAQTSDLKEINNNAIFLQFGEAGSNDAIELRQRYNGQESLICRGNEAEIATSFLLNIKILKDSNDNWKVFVDRQLNDEYQLEGEGYCEYASDFQYFGLFCNYTNGNIARFYYDNFYFGNWTTDTILYYKPRRYDIVIHEIMPKPLPAVGLPSVEYVELYNRSELPLILKNLSLQIGKNKRILPTIHLQAGDYALIVDDDDLSYFSAYRNVYGISSLSLTDAGQELTLKDENDSVIHYVKYSEEWHCELIKRNGGWALEMIDNDLPCQGYGNWTSSIALSGGTPLAPNSVYSSIGDIQHPFIERITIVDSITAKVFFNEPIERLSEDAVHWFSVNRGMKVLQIEENPPDFQALTIHFSNSFQYKILYTLKIKDSLCDCAGNAILSFNNISFGIPSQPEKGDIIINEIMMNPKNDEKAKYIELYNKSNKILEMNKLFLGIGKNTVPDKIVSISSGFLLLPQSYYVVCQNKNITINQYDVPYSERLLNCDSFPNFSKTMDGIFLIDKSLQLIDKMDYSESLHYELLKDYKGVALERLNFDCESGDENCWASAAESYGFGTPGYTNSQYIDMNIHNSILQLYPEVISPNQDGQDDILTINCRFEIPETRASLTIYNDKGIFIKRLVNNALCGIEEHWFWNGISEQGSLSPHGFYIVLLEYWNIKGKKEQKKAVFGIR
jgi:hypothetical protein